jgi:hypothetical protein
MRSRVTGALLVARIALAIPATAAASASARISGSESVEGIIVISWGGEGDG